MIYLYNSLTRKKEPFKPLNSKKITVYNCGPTVYNYVTIGNWRTYVLGDLVVRALKYFNYQVDYVMNITDVGHLTGDNIGDADTGEDRQEKAARREGKTARQVADFYTADFLRGYDKLNLTKPKTFCKATDHIKEQIKLVSQLVKKGYTYKTPDGIYFDTLRYEKNGHSYPKLTTLDQLKEGARVAKNPFKKNPRDFALWKLSPKDKQRQMEWDSPWGIGFPGWHIECSAMSMKYLGKQIDIHIGGEDLRTTHHPNEILQSEAATGKKPFVRYWIHGAFLTVDNGRMGKSLGNAYNLQDIEKKGLDSLALRYFYFTGHYRKPLNFTWKALDGAQQSLDRIREILGERKEIKEREERKEKYENDFQQAVGNDLDMPAALSVLWQMLRDSKLSHAAKRQLALKWDQILGLDLGKKKAISIPAEIKQLIKQREQLRRQKKFTQADRVRQKITQKGYTVKDRKNDTTVRKTTT